MFQHTGRHIKEYDELLVRFVLINQYIFYAEVFFLIGIPSFMRMPAAHIKNGEDPMGKYGTALDITQYINLFVCLIMCISVFWIVVFNL